MYIQCSVVMETIDVIIIEADNGLSSLLQAIPCKTVVIMTRYTQDAVTKVITTKHSGFPSLNRLICSLQTQSISGDVTIHLQLPTDTIKTLCSHADHMIQCVAQMGIKWVLNALTTGAHVIKGKVVRNLMVDVQVR